MLPRYISTRAESVKVKRHCIRSCQFNLLANYQAIQLRMAAMTLLLLSLMCILAGVGQVQI